jgi:hypothetical protein
MNGDRILTWDLYHIQRAENLRQESECLAGERRGGRESIVSLSSGLVRW